MPTPRDTEPLKILVYSDNARTREKVRSALGKRVHPDLPELSYLDVATAPITRMGRYAFIPLCRSLVGLSM